MMAFWLAMGTMVLATAIVLVLSFRRIPGENEILLGTVVGFVFGNMVGPVYRKVFGGMDPEARKSQIAQNQNLKQAMQTIAASPPVVGPGPIEVLVTNPTSDPVPVASKEEAIY